MSKNNFGLVLGVIIIALVVWGLIGSSIAAEVGTNCDIGIGDDGSVFCWKWHQNVIGDIGDKINEVLGK